MSDNRKSKNSSGALTTALALGLASIFAGCTSTSQKHTDLFSGLGDMNAKSSAVEEGMSLEEFSDTIGIPVDQLKLMKMNRSEINLYRSGGEVQYMVQSAEQKEQIENALKGTTGYLIPYENTKDSWFWHYTLVHINEKEVGESGAIWAIFEDGKLVDHDYSGKVIDSKERNSIVPSGRTIVKEGVDLVM